jgi:cytochrome P450
MGGDVMAGLDAPVHRRSRTLVSAGFAHRSLPPWTALIQDVINELMEQLARRSRADLVENFTLQFPAPVMAGIVGLPREDYPRFQAWAAEILSVAAGRGRTGVTASLLMRNYLAAKLAERRLEPRDDLISALAHAEVEGSRLSDREIFSFLRLLLSAGIETTYRSAGTLLFALLTHPDQLDAVRQDRSLLPRAIEEGLRWDPPVLFIRRRSTRDTRIGEVDVPAGSAVTLMLSSANRDESRWDRPDEFDVRREPQPNLAFGSGPHVCLGLHLARLEIQVAVGTLLDRYPNLRLDPDAEPPEIGGYVFRAPPALPVLLG